MITFQELAALYFDKHLIKKSSYCYYRRLYKQLFATWTEHKTCFELKTWHDALELTPAHANKALGFLKAMYYWAQREGDATGKQALWCQDNPAANVQRHRQESRERIFSDRELTQLFLYLSFASQKLETFITFLLCTGCRMSEARMMKWAHLDLVQGIWFKPTTKNGMSQRIPLSRQAIAALESMPRDGDYVFMGVYGRCWSRCGAEKAWGIFRKGPGLQDLTLHDIRRTVGSRVYEQTKDVMLVKAVLNHRPNSITEIYMRTQYKRIATALQDHADALWVLRKEIPYESLYAAPVVPEHAGFLPVGSESSSGSRTSRMGTIPDA
jgi:integrase